LQIEALWDTCLTVADIKEALLNLPKDLEETYCRCLRRITGCHWHKYTSKILRWVGSASRPLQLEELEEAVAFDLEDRHWSLEKIPRLASILGYCANLVVLDAADQCVRFAHPSVKQYLEEIRDDEIQMYRIDADRGVLACGEFCVAYLSFSNFGLQLEKGSITMLPVPQGFIAALAPGRMGAIISKISGARTQKADQQGKSFSMKVSKTPKPVENWERYRFLDYAVTNWASQTKMITRQSTVWEMFYRLATNPNRSLNFQPWTSGGQSLTSHLHGVLGWAVKEHHMPLLKIVLDLGPRYGLKDFYNLPPIGDSLPTLHVASRLGFEDVIELLLEVCAVNEIDEEGYTALHHAAEKGNLEIAKLISNAKGAKIERQSNLGFTPLCLAAMGGYEQIVSLLIKSGAKFTADDEKGWTPILYAASNGHEAVVELLLKEGADFTNPMLLQSAVENGHEAVVELLLKKGADFKHPMMLQLAAEKGHEAVVKLLLKVRADKALRAFNSWTHITFAAYEGHEAVVKLLLDKGADIESRNDVSKTPLLWAAAEGHEAVVKLLLEKGANIESRDSCSRTPLLCAVEGGHAAVVKQLLEKGANIESRDIWSQTTLSIATLYGRQAVVKQLLEKGANIESRDSSGRTPLSIATRCGRQAVVKQLLEKGANIESRDIWSQTTLSIATLYGRQAVVKQLLEKGANIESRDTSGQRPLSIAAEEGHEAVVKLLLENGANKETKSRGGNTALMLAKEFGHEEIVKLLNQPS
jgi:ankyrin repeat protein